MLTALTEMPNWTCDAASRHTITQIGHTKLLPVARQNIIKQVNWLYKHLISLTVLQTYVFNAYLLFRAKKILDG